MSRNPCPRSGCARAHIRMKRIHDDHTSGPPDGRIFEVKFEVSKRLTALIRSLLRHNASTPRSFHSAELRTTYFDDAEETSFFEARDGHITKSKYRLREYVDPEEGGAFYSIEVKLRHGAMTSKVKELIFRRLPEGYRLTTFRDLVSTFERIEGRSLARVASMLPEERLTPSTVVRYSRLRFDDRSVEARYNLDTRISVCPRRRPGGEERSWIGLGHDVFEIKTKVPGFHPEFMKDVPLQQGSFSKFVWGRESQVAI